MWKKLETLYSDNTAREFPATTPRPSRTTPGQAVVGPSISIQGDLSGDEDLLIQGRVEGKIELKQHNITVGQNGVVKADIFAKTIIVEGKLKGNLNGDEQVIIRGSGDVRGNIIAPRVVLEDGALFKGSIDMEPRRAEAQSSGQAKLEVASSHKEHEQRSVIGKESPQSVGGDKQVKSA